MNLILLQFTKNEAIKGIICTLFGFFFLYLFENNEMYFKTFKIIEILLANEFFFFFFNKLFKMRPW